MFNCQKKLSQGFPAPSKPNNLFAPNRATAQGNIGATNPKARGSGTSGSVVSVQIEDQVSLMIYHLPQNYLSNSCKLT